VGNIENGKFFHIFLKNIFLKNDKLIVYD